MLERRGDAIRFHPRLLALANHYGYDPRPVAPYRGNEKGRVERTIRYLRTSFFPLRHDWDIEALNRDAEAWSIGQASARPWPQDRRRSVEQAYSQERGHLLPIPGDTFPCHEQVAATLRRTPYVRFDANRYSVPHDRVGRPVLIVADLEQIRVFDGSDLVATHPRDWGKGQVIEKPEHIDALWRSKRRARQHRGQERLLRVVPRAEELLTALARRQRHLASAIATLLELLDAYGVEELRAAIGEAIDHGTPHPHAVRLILDRRGRARDQHPPSPSGCPTTPRSRTSSSRRIPR